jgi:amino-acid N-acetyltransferase
VIRKAKTPDVKKIGQLINACAREGGSLLPRSPNELYENMRDFFVWEEGRRILGCCALHISWEDLAEVKSLAVTSGARRKGIGGKLLNRAFREAEALGIKKIFVLTNQKEFFQRRGFKNIKKEKLPHKIWGECIRCSKFSECDETAMIYFIKNKK